MWEELNARVDVGYWGLWTFKRAVWDHAKSASTNCRTKPAVINP